MSKLKKLLVSKNLLRFKDKTIKISPFSYVDVKSKIASNTYIDRFCILNNVTMNSYSYMGYGCKLNNVEIGKYCSFAGDIKIGLGKHPTHLLSSSPIFYSSINPFNINVDKKLEFNDKSKKTIIGNDVWIGANVIIMDGITIGDGAVIGAGSIVTKDIDPYSINVGIPCKKIKDRFTSNEIELIKSSRWWERSPIEVTQLKIYEYFRR